MRTQMRNLLGSVPGETLQTASSRICHHIAGDKLLLAGKNTLAIFASHGAEVDVSGLHQLLPSTTLAYPLCHPKGILGFHAVPSPDQLIPGILGIREPDPAIHPEICIPDIDLFFCPGLMFGHDGSRLGHGGGYYDRALEKKSPHAEAWGVCLELQMSDSVVREEHDQLLCGTISESGITHSIRD